MPNPESGDTTGFAAVFRRELARIARTPRIRWLGLWLPLLVIALLMAVFHAQTPRHLPVILVDHDHSALSRQLARTIAAAPAVTLDTSATDLRAAGERVRAGRVFAVIAIPPDFERDVLRGHGAQVQVFHNSQAMTAGNVVLRDVRLAVGTFNAGVAMRRGVRPAIGMESHALFNPGLDYGQFLALPLIAAILHIALVILGADATGRELRERRAGSWFAAAGGRIVPALGGKLAPYALTWSLGGWLVLMAALRWFGVAIAGSALLWGLGWVALVLASLGLGAFMVAVFANLRLAVSAASLVVSPAFAYSGVTFPLLGMSGFAYVWASALPLSHYLALQTGQMAMATPWLVDAQHLLPLLLVAALPWLLAGRWRRLLTDESRWGAQ